MMSFYIASSFKNIETVQIVSQRLRQEGLNNSYDWTLNENITSIDQLKDIGNKEIEAVMNSNFIVVILPAGKGSHVELGIAIGNGIKVFLYSQNDEIDDLENTSTFYHVDGICKCKGTVEELIQIIFEELKTNEIYK